MITTARTGRLPGLLQPALILSATIATLALGSCGVGDSGNVSACTQRGVAYFKEIGSYPRLSNGRDALDVAQERCNRTTTAF